MRNKMLAIRVSAQLMMLYALCGCATAPVQVTADNYCKLSRKISWSVADSTETISQVRRANAVRRRVCK